MHVHDDELERIKEILRNHPRGMKITHIAREIAMNRNSVAKYLEILLATRQVDMLRHGMSKIFILSQRPVIPTMLDFSSDFVLVLDRNTRIVQISENFLKFSGVKMEVVKGMLLDSVNLPVVSQPLILQKIKEARFGVDIKTEITFRRDTGEFFFDVRITPTVFNDGKPGITIIIEDSTEKKRNELFLKGSEAKFRALFWASPLGTAVFDSSGHLLEVNDEFQNIFGFRTRTEIGFMVLFSVLGGPPSSLEALKNGKKVVFESVIDFDLLKEQTGFFTKKSGRNPLKVRIVPVRLDNGSSLPGYLFQIQDSDSRMKNIIDKAPDRIARFNHELKYLYVNRGIETMVGIPQAAFVGRTNRELGIPDELGSLWDRAIRDVFSTGRSASFEFSFAGSDGIHQYQARIEPERDVMEDITSVVTAIHDITPATRPVHGFEDNRMLLQEILSCIDEAVILVDCTTETISFVNRTAEKVFGFTAGEFSGKDPASILGYTGNMYQQPGKLSDSFRKEGNYETESLLKRNNCENFRAKLHLRPLYDDTGCIQHIIAVIRDLSGQVNEGMPQGYSLPLPHDDRHDTIHTRHQHQVQ